MKKYTRDAKRFYDSKSWKVCRESYIKNRIIIDGGICEHCKKSRGEIVDHKEELDENKLKDATISLNHDNLQYLCLPCSNRKTFCKDDRLICFDDEGNPIFIDNDQT